MSYQPNDQQKLIDISIALDVAVSTFFTVVNRHDRDLASDIAKGMRSVSPGIYDKFPNDQAANIAGKLTEWMNLLTSQPNSAGRI